jgi:uncharacterized protein DUF6228
MEAFRLTSCRDAFELLLGPVTGEAGAGTFPARLVGGPATAEVRAYDTRCDSLADFFGELAAQPRGWEGVKEWMSLEEHMPLSATMDRLGHVFLRVRLLDHGDPSDWRVEATLLLESGQLDALARGGRRVFDARAAE